MGVLILLVAVSIGAVVLIRIIQDVIRVRKGEYHVFTYEWERGEETPTHSVIVTDDQGDVVRVTETKLVQPDQDDLIKEVIPA